GPAPRRGRGGASWGTAGGPCRARGDAPSRARADPFVGVGLLSPPPPPDPARAGASLPRRCQPDTGAVRRAGTAALHVPRAPRGHGAEGRPGDRRTGARGGAADGGG